MEFTREATITVRGVKATTWHLSNRYIFSIHTSSNLRRVRKPNLESRKFHQVHPRRTLKTTTSYFTLTTLVDVKGKARSRGFGSNLHLSNCALR